MPPAIDPRLRHVGNRIRHHRQHAGWTLSGLAAAAGIGKGTLSELEHGHRNPTLETLYALAGILGVPLAVFVADSGSAGGGVAAAGRPTPREGASVRDDTVDARILEARRLDDGSIIEVYWLRIGPGRRVSPGHGAGVSERLVVVAGEAVVGPIGQASRVSAGDVLAWESTGRHVYSSETGAEGVLTIVNAPAPGS